jgi:hypothetical protein
MFSDYSKLWHFTSPSRRKKDTSTLDSSLWRLANSAFEVTFFGVCPFAGFSVKGHELSGGEFCGVEGSFAE